MKFYLEYNESVVYFFNILENYKSAYTLRKSKIDTLYDEAKAIKKLKV